MKSIRLLIQFFTILVISFAFLGCANFGKKLKAFLNGGSAPVAATQAGKPKKKHVKFSDNPQLMYAPQRQYKRTTKKKLQNEAGLDANSGSLWVMEGQGAYLFSQNIMRMIGDPLPVKIEGEPKQQLNTKVKVIKKLLAKLQARKKVRRRDLAKATTKPEADKNKANEGGAAQKPEANNTAANEKSDKQEVLDGFNVKTVPTRIVERLADGNYRVRGSQPFMIGQREYKVIVTGIVRAEDFSDEGISSTKLLDPRYDIVSTRRRGTSL